MQMYICLHYTYIISYVLYIYINVDYYINIYVDTKVYMYTQYVYMYVS